MEYCEQVDSMEADCRSSTANRPSGNCRDQEASDTEHRKKIMVVSVAVTLEKIRHWTGTELLTELINSMHNDNFELRMFKEMIRSWEDCRDLTEEVINENMAKETWTGK